MRGTGNVLSEQHNISSITVKLGLLAGFFKLSKARFAQEGIFFALNLFAGKILLIKKLEIEKTKN